MRDEIELMTQEVVTTNDRDQTGGKLLTIFHLLPLHLTIPVQKIALEVDGRRLTLGWLDTP